MPGELLLEDSLYFVCADKKEERGCFTYFFEKATKKIFATYSYSPRQAVKFKGEYYILCDGLKYARDTTGIIKIKDPKQFVEITFQQAEQLNILFTHLAASPGKETEALADTIQKRKYINYGYPDNYDVPIYTFQRGDNLYSIIKTDSLIYLGRHAGNTVDKVQVLFDTIFETHHIYPVTYNNNTLVVFSSSGAKSVHGLMVDFFNCGFFDIRPSEISLHRIYREYKLPSEKR